MAVQTVVSNTNIDNVYTPFFVSVGTTTTADSSPIPTLAWTARTLPSSSNWQSVAFGNDILLAVSSTSGTSAALSVDGATWTGRTMSVSASWYAITFGNGIFVATATGNVQTAITTPDGINWTSRNIGITGNWKCICFGNDKFVTLSAGSSNAAYSSDGITWSGSTLPSSSNWSGVTYDSTLGKFVAVAGGTTNGAYSTDGITWSGSTMISNIWTTIISNDRGRFIAISSTTNSGTTYSDDGINWNIGGWLPYSQSWTCGDYGENYNADFGRWVVKSSGSNRSSWSIDGLSWTNVAQTNATYNSCVYAPIPWRSNDTLTINNGAIVTVNTNQTKFWSAITINDGRLNVKNTSTSTAIRFTTGRSSGAAAQTITPTAGIGVIDVSGNTIQIGVGDNTTGQTLTAPYTDHIPCVWVETSSGSSVYDIWLNVTGVYGPSLPKFVEGLDSVSTGQTGKFFVQIPNPIQDTVLILTGSTIYGNTRTIILSSTSNIYVGATITGSGIPVNAVIEKIVDLTTVEMNLLATTNSTSVTVTIYNPFSQQLTNQIQFGNNINGNVLSTGVRVRIPNIMMTSDTSTKIQTLSSVVGMSFVMTAGGICLLENCLFDEAYHNFTQSQILSIKNVGMTIPPLIVEVYNLTIDGLGMGLPPVRRYFATYWFQRDVRDIFASVFITMTYTNNATINNLVAVVNELTMTAGSSTAPVGFLTLGYSSGLVVSNCRFYKLQQYIAWHHGIVTLNPVIDSTFTNIECYGCLPISLITSSNNTFTNIIFSTSIFNQSMGYIAGQRFSYNPETGLDFVNDTKYYFKTRSYYTRDRLSYADSEEFSATPFTGTTYFPDYFTCYCNDKTSVLLAWTNRSPVHNNPSYEIYRSTTSGFTIDSTTRVFSTNTAATVTWTNAGPKPTMTAAAGRTLTFTNNRQITASTGSFITDGYLVNDTLMVTGTILNNRKYTITGVTALTLGVAEGVITETAYAATAVIKATHAVNHPTITATASRTLTFNVGKTITAAGASPGNFLFDGYIVGDVIEITGCVNATNNGTKTISVITATVITVLETLATEATYSATATITGKEILDNTKYYYKLRKYDSAGVYSDSAEQEVYVHDPYIISTNFILQNNIFDNASWVKPNTSNTPNLANSPTSLMSATAANQLVADRLVATSNNATISQNVTLASGTTYTFSVFVAVNQTESFTGCSASISLGNQVTNFTAISAWQRVSVSYTATGLTSATITIKTNTDALMLSSAMLNIGNTPDPPIATTTAAVTNNNTSRFPILMRTWCRTYGGESDNSGIEIQFNATTPTSSILQELYCSSNSGFTPSIQNRLCNIGGSGEPILSLYNASSNNVFTNITQVGKGFPSASSYAAYLNIACSNNKFINVSMDTVYSVFTNLIYIALASNDNFFHNWSVKHYRNYPGVNPFYAVNTASGIIAQNIRMDTYDFPLGNQILNVILKGCSGANATPANAAVTYSLGSTTDGIAIAYGQVYDVIFNELYFSLTTGALHLLFNASAKIIKPYTILSGNPKFGNTGKLYFEQVGDSIEYTWPHKILGVSGFTSTVLKLSGLDLGTSTDRLEGLKVEYSINNAEYKLAIPANLTGETVSATDGFYFKVKLTAMQGMKYGTQTNSFVVGEQIEGTTSGSRAYVTNNFNLGATGTLWLSGITGTFIAGELVRNYSDKQTRATNVATNTFALFPSFTSYIDGLQFFTTIDNTVNYPETIVAAQLELTNLVNNTEVRVYRVSDGVEIAGTEDTSGSTFTYDYTWEGTDIMVNIIIYALSYVPVNYYNTTLGQYGVSIPVQQQFDRWFSNP